MGLRTEQTPLVVSNTWYTMSYDLQRKGCADARCVDVAIEELTKLALKPADISAPSTSTLKCSQFRNPSAHTCYLRGSSCAHARAGVVVVKTSLGIGGGIVNHLTL